MKFIFRLNSFLISFLLLVTSNFFACQNKKTKEIDPIRGRYAIIRGVDTATGKESEIPNNLFLYFFQGNAIIFGHLYTDISYATKKVKLKSYSIFNNVDISGILKDGNNNDYVTIINLIKKGENIAEFIRVNNNDFLIHQNYLYEIVHKENLDRDKFEIAKKNRKIYRSKPLYEPLKTTGAFIGLRDDSKKNCTYYTLYIYSDYNTMNVYFIDNLVIPKSNGYLIANSSKKIVGGALKDDFQFNFTKNFKEEHDNSFEFDNYYIYEPSIINYASPYMISLKINNKNFFNNTFRERYETYSIEKDGLRNKLNVHDIIGENWINTVIDNIYFDYLNDINYKIIPSNIGIVRRNGYWILKTHLFGGKSIDDIYVRIRPNYLKQDSNRNFISMEQIKELYTSAVDYTVSPESSLAIVNTGSNLKVISLYSSQLKIKDSFSMINNNLSLIMDNWLVGSEAEAHLYNIKKSNRWIKIY